MIEASIQKYPEVLVASVPSQIPSWHHCGQIQVLWDLWGMQYSGAPDGTLGYFILSNLAKRQFRSLGAVKSAFSRRPKCIACWTEAGWSSDILTLPLGQWSDLPRTVSLFAGFLRDILQWTWSYRSSLELIHGMGQNIGRILVTHLGGSDWLTTYLVQSLHLEGNEQTMKN